MGSPERSLLIGLAIIAFLLPTESGRDRVSSTKRSRNTLAQSPED
ncbi:MULTISPECIES: hypothetical protein [Cyanophyceae]|nr:hypothetical protein [Trichocoleus sp. FACHB-6]